MCINKQEIVNIFNDYFLKNLVEIIGIIPKRGNSELLANECSMVFRMLSYGKLKDIVFKMPNGADDFRIEVVYC